MGEYRSEAEIFVTSFLDYIDEYDILDKLDRRTQKMVRSAGVESLIAQARNVFPKRIEKGQTIPVPAPEVVDQLVQADNVIDTREMFARKTAENGGVRAMLRAIVEGRPDASEAFEQAKEFLAAEDGKKEFAVPPKKEN